MYFLVALFLVLAPLDILAIHVGSGRIFVSWLVCGALDFAGLMYVISSRWQLARGQAKILIAFVVFLIVASYSLLTSPYFGSALGKGLVQVTGVAAMLFLLLCVSRIINGRLSLLLGVIRVLSVTLGVIGFVAVFQFVVNNAAGADVVTFQLLERVFGNQLEYGTVVGSLIRANGIISEPSHLGTYLSAGSGLALIRLGLFGRLAKQRLADCVPGWAAVGIVAGLIVAFSIVGLGAFGVATAATFAIGTLAGRRRVLTRRTLGYIIGGCVTLSLFILLPFWYVPKLTDKLATAALAYEVLSPATTNNLKIRPGEQNSAVVFATNAVVAVRNLESRPLIGIGIGAHPDSYAVQIPEFIRLDPETTGVNKDDADSLLLRLLSETGILGTSAFLVGLLAILAQGWKTARFCRRVRGADKETEILFLVAVATTGSCVGVIAAYLARFGAYFDAPLWAILALTASLGPFAEKVRRAVRARALERPQPLQQASVPTV